MKGAMSAQKALQRSKTETRELLGGTEENSISSKRGPSRQISDFSQKRKKKIVKKLVARPDAHCLPVQGL